MDQISQSVSPTRKSRTRKQPRNQARFSQNKPRPFKITAEIEHRNDGHGENLGISNFGSTVFMMMKPASWLNMAEIELSVLARQCL
ncbi:MAG TPA: hypothetical protein PKY82_35580, partial [Pyrinomonadaceae bacterium]|nr:hypothetical protein [Pyrinomonadaceae bacterium]